MNLPFIFPPDVGLNQFLEELSKINPESARNWGTIFDCLDERVIGIEIINKFDLHTHFWFRIEQIRRNRNDIK